MNRSIWQHHWFYDSQWLEDSRTDGRWNFPHCQSLATMQLVLVSSVCFPRRLTDSDADKLSSHKILARSPSAPQLTFGSATQVACCNQVDFCSWGAVGLSFNLWLSSVPKVINASWWNGHVDLDSPRILGHHYACLQSLSDFFHKIILWGYPVADSFPWGRHLCILLWRFKDFRHRWWTSSK